METVEFRNARVVDGSGTAPVEAAVLVGDGRIQRVSTDPAGADRVIDVEGSYLAPGFVDMHAHSDLRLFSHPGATEKLTQGFTLEVLGQDGVSVAPVPPALQEEWAQRIQSLNGTFDGPWPWTTVDEYLEELAAADPAVNCAYYAPHGNLRSLLVGFEDRPLPETNVVATGSTEALIAEQGEYELAHEPAPGSFGALQRQLATALDQGAFGLSTGMIYPPSSYGRDDELIALAETLAARDAYMISHVWNETDRVVESIQRYIDICERGGCDPHVSHLKVGGEPNWGRSEAVLGVFDEATARGTNVSFDQYPYTAGSTMLTALLPPWARTGDTDSIEDRLRDGETRDRIARDIRSPEGDWENLARAAGTWENILVTQTASGRYEGETVADIAADRGVEPIDAMCDLLVAEDLDVTMVDFVLDEADIERFLADERGTICSDGIFGGKPHPRAVGTGARILERYVRERDVLSIEDAIYKLAGRPADLLGLPDRGRIAEGYVADLVVFDLESVEERATYHDPMNLSRGMEYVLVGGEIAVEQGVSTGVRPGSVLRSVEEWDGTSRPRLRSR
ncbi:N-acyl-D-amino-acid deacylase family protein [Haloarcula laminariae]|uniref:N-acyl-D-amino-acid deacylase family protein n=1 Tax=Haloarcula laminariae TaxID=2961577 RepID=UPI002405FB23|nr:D-aminoacylase [Halomicroarcula sp. FL173]